MDVRRPRANTPTPASPAANWSERRLTGKKVQLKLDAFLPPPPPSPAHPLPPMRLMPCSSLVKPAPTMHQTLRLCGQRVCVVYGDWQMFLPTEKCISRVIFLRKTACPRGWSPLPSPLPSLLPKLPNLVPNPQPRVQPNLLPRWQPRLQPSLQLESPFLWPLWSMYSSSESNTPGCEGTITWSILGYVPLGVRG